MGKEQNYSAVNYSAVNYSAVNYSAIKLTYMFIFDTNFIEIMGLHLIDFQIDGN